MAKNLVVVESPAKAKTIGKYLGPDYRVMASIGHIKDLPSKGLGVDVNNNFEPTYEVIPDTKKRNNRKVISELKSAAKEAEAIYLDRKSTRLNSSHLVISYAVFCLKKKKHA